jgi:hypothetical protein
MGVDFKTRSLVSSHSLYLSVSKSLPESASCSQLKVLTTTPTSKFMRKKLANMANTMKKKIQKV